MEGTIYGVLTLNTLEHSQSAKPDFNAIFAGCSRIEIGSHLLRNPPPHLHQDLDYWHGHTGVEERKVFDTTRNITLCGFRTGEDSETNMVNTVIHNVLTMNSEMNSKTYTELVYSKLFLKTEGRFFISLEINSSQPKFVLMSRGVSIYMTAVCDGQSTYLVWSNEINIEEKFKTLFGNRFYYYRFRTLLDTACVIQSKFLRSRYLRWSKEPNDRLKLLNLVDYALSKRLIVNPVN